MDDLYSPSSSFLVAVVNGEAPLIGSVFGDQNLKQLLSLMTDQDTSNRDWATFLLANHEIDTPEVRLALLGATQDAEASVRAEALSGLALRDPAQATPLIARELCHEECGYGTFEAARYAADTSLLNELIKWRGRGGGSWIDAEIEDAIRACQANIEAE